MGLRVCKPTPAGVTKFNKALTGNGYTGTVVSEKCYHRQLQQPQKVPLYGHISLDHSRNIYSTAIMSVHVKARCKIYPRTKDVERFKVPDDKVPWDVDFPEYSPIDFTSETVKKQPVWADPVDPNDVPAFNCIQENPKVDRNSFEGEVQCVNGYPRNPRGRTGVTSRGSLGRWGPNHAADPIVTRWKRDKDNEKVLGADGKPILQFVAVQRRDCGEWALPGGMVDPGENRTATLIREFGEEAMNSLEASPEEKICIKAELETFFKGGDAIYEGYVDDPRNTDNCWMETKAINFHDEKGSGLGAFNLHAGDDAADVQWMDISSTLSLYASHIDFIKATVELRLWWEKFKVNKVMID
ncbi:ADP catabolic process [Mactra antiquata]